VTLHPDGTHTAETQKFTPGDDIDFETVSQVSCRGAALGFYDLPAGENGADQICFTGTGVANLSDYTDSGTGTSWAGQIASYLTTGTGNLGYFSYDSEGYNHCDEFAAVTTQTNVISGISGLIDYITLGPTACPQLSCGSGQFACEVECDGYWISACEPDDLCSGCNEEQWANFCLSTLCP
jgi:hypothetical protein